MGASHRAAAHPGLRKPPLAPTINPIPPIQRHCFSVHFNAGGRPSFSAYQIDYLVFVKAKRHFKQT